MNNKFFEVFVMGLFILNGVFCFIINERIAALENTPAPVQTCEGNSLPPEINNIASKAFELIQALDKLDNGDD